jgi:hypothetical protein
MFFSLLFPGAAFAQENVPIATIEIDLWPEYDRPEMLVIYRVQLSADVSLPAELSFRIPTAVGMPNAVAVRDQGGSLLNAPYERTVEGDWAYISLTATLPGIQLEYYDPQLSKNGSQREYQFNWESDYEIESLFIQLQQPSGASQVTMVPAATNTSPSSDGLTYHTIDLGIQNIGSKETIRIGYFKETDALTVEDFQVQPSAPISNDTSGRTNIVDLLPWALGALGFLLVFGGIWWYWRMGQQQPKRKTQSRGRRSSRSKVQSLPKTEDEGVYCHECGKRAGVGDRFCRSCGTKLRLT